MATIEDFFGTYQFRLQGNTNPKTYPPGQPVTIGPSLAKPGTAILRWVAQGKAFSADQIPFDEEAQALFGIDLIGRAGSTTYPVDIRISLGLAADDLEGKTVLGDLYGDSAGPLVGQWGAETQPPFPIEAGRRVGKAAVQNASV